MSAWRRKGQCETVAVAYHKSIFFNCPFFDFYRPIFDALVVAAFDCGYVPRCALEADDVAQARVEKIDFGDHLRVPLWRAHWF